MSFLYKLRENYRTLCAKLTLKSREKCGIIYSRQICGTFYGLLYQKSWRKRLKNAKSPKNKSADRQNGTCVIPYFFGQSFKAVPRATSGGAPRMQTARTKERGEKIYGE